MAIVVDVREGNFLSQFPTVFRRLRKMPRLNPVLIFLEATNVALVRRFSETRRPHPLAPGRSVSEGIREERSRMNVIRAMADVPATFRFASTGPFYVEVGLDPRRVSRASARFFLDWVRERMKQIKLDDSRQQEEVLQHHRAAERFWQEKVAVANAE